MSEAMVTLWSINRWLRYTGFRLVLELPDRPGEVGARLGFVWVGLPGPTLVLLGEPNPAEQRRWEG